MITDSAGVVKTNRTITPWGGELQFVNNDSNHYKFTGKERDFETGLDYFGARYYSNGFGRWVSADWSPTPVPVPYADFGDPQSLNQYVYVRNIPTVGVDADGHDGCCSLSDVFNFVAGAANAYGSDALLGAGRMEQTTTAGKLGSVIGDGAAAYQGVQEATVGVLGDAVGFVADATGLGALGGVPVNIISTAAVLHGAGTTLTAVVHLSKTASESGGSKGEDFTPSAKKEIDARDGNKCQTCGRDVRSAQNKKGQLTPADQRQRHHIKPKSEGGKGTAENGKTLCPDCHKEEHRKMREAKKKEKGES